MRRYWWCAILFRVVLPFSVVTAVFIRPIITSYIYLVVGCYMPFFSVPSSHSMAKSTGTYMKILIITCILTTTLVLSFYIALFFRTKKECDLELCSTLDSAGRIVGVMEFERLSLVDAIPWFLPEPLMLVTSLILHIAFKRLCACSAVIQATKDKEDTDMAKELKRKNMASMLVNLGKYYVVFHCCLTAVLRATAFGAIYYLVFLSVMTYWTCNQRIDKVFGRILVTLIPIIFINMIVMIGYQFQYFYGNRQIISDSIWGRLFNLVPLKTYKNYTDPKLLKFRAQPTHIYVVPICLYVLYILVVLVSREVLRAEDGFKNLMTACFKYKQSNYKMQRQKILLIQQKVKYDKLDNIGASLADKIKLIIEQILQFIISISYLATNFTIMVWAIVYVSWKTLILLIWANLIWLLPSRKRVILLTSPLIVAWVWFLLVTSYLYSMDLTSQELPSRFGFVNMKSGHYCLNRRLGELKKYKWLHQLTQSLFGMIIFVTMRQLWQERTFMKQQRMLMNEVAVPTPIAAKSLEEGELKLEFLVRFKKACLEFFATWWIWVVVLTMIWMGFWTTSNIFRIVFVALAMVLLTTFQLCRFKPWKRFLSVYWWIVIVYAMLNLFAVYLYQISITRNVMHKLFSEEQFRLYGFEKSDPKKVTAALAIPIFFQFAVIIQKNFLQKEFDRITSPSSPEELLEQEEKLRKLKNFVNNFIDMVCKILEVHLQKVTLLVGWYMCLFDMCAIFIPCVFLFTASCVFGRTFTNITMYFVSCIVQVFIVCRLLYMNQYKYHDSWNYVGFYKRDGKMYNKTLNTADWVGFHQSQHGMEWADFQQLYWCFLYVFMVTITRMVTIRIQNYRESWNLRPARRRVIFPEINFENCHQNTITILKYLANYGFYKFGCEISLFFTTIVIAQRMDVVAIILPFWLLLMFALKRTWVRILWLPSLVIVAIVVPAEYMATLGWWPSFWKNTLTDYWNSNNFLLRVQQFCYMLNMAHPPNKKKIILDFWLLLLLSRQWRSFRKEWMFRGIYFFPGSNEDVSGFVDDVEVENPVPDFVTYTRGYLDTFKRVFFTCWFYASLGATFLAGTLRPSLYSFGYILGAFIFAWEGTDMFLRPPKVILRRWNFLIAYTILVMMIGTINQIFGCIFIYETYIPFNCYIYQFFSMGCVDKFHTTRSIPNMNTTGVCSVDHSSSELSFDCTCFFFLIFQQRIFKSFHFFHLVNDAKAQTILADRGVGLIERIRLEKRAALDAQDAQIRKNIKRKLDRVRAAHQRAQGEIYDRRKKTHDFILKSSDYYMFDDEFITSDIPLLPPKEEKVTPEDFDPYDPPPLSEYFALFHSTNVQTVLVEKTLRRHQKVAVKEGRNPEDLRKALYNKPGSSKDPNLPFAMLQPKWYKFDIVLVFLWGAFESWVVSVTGLINRSTRSFRDILNNMFEEKMALKEKTKYSEGVRLGNNQIWHPSQNYTEILESIKKGNEVGLSPIQYSIYVKLLRALFYMFLAYSEWLCYLIIIINQITTASFISLPLMIITFCWGALTVPKPSRTFWATTIAYVLIMLFVKNFLVMTVAQWSSEQQATNLFFPSVVIGITRDTNVTFNFLILVIFFFHRMVLQMQGLWMTYTDRSISLIPDGDYVCKDGKLVVLAGENNTGLETLQMRTVEVAMSDYFQKSIGKRVGKYAENFRLFMQQLISPSSTQIPVDVYTPMFLCDLVNICLILFYYGSFHTEDKNHGVIYFVQNNTVPTSFIVTVLLYFVLMVIDRVIYLRKNRFSKLVFHYFQVVSCHLYFFILYSLISNKKFTATPVVQTFYVFKCLYFLFSAYQIRNGYPPLISFHHLWFGRSLFNRLGYKFYRLIPYFFEIRTLLDWICSDSSLGVNDWFKMEAITYNIFDQICSKEFDAKWSQPAEQAKSRLKKFIMGGLLYVLLILTVIFPFLLFSLGSTVGVRTHPAKFKIELYMGSAGTIFEAYALQRNLKILSQEDYKNLTSTFRNIQSSEEIFGAFQPSDVVVVTWSAHSLTKWKVSPGNLKELMKDVMSNEPFTFRIEISYTHIGHGNHKVQRTFGQMSRIPPLPNVHRQNLITILQSNKTLNSSTWLPLIFPKFLFITKEAEPRPLTIMGELGHPEIYEQFKELDGSKEDDDDADIPADPRIERNLVASLQFDPEGEMWWHIAEDCTDDDDNYFYYLKDLVHNRCDILVMYTFNERVFPSAINYITQSGILGLYLLYFMMVIGIIRSCRVKIGNIWIEDLPNSELIMQKCLEVYVARDMQNYELEEELFAELIFIMRSREVLIKLTRYKDNKYDPPLSVVTKERN
ncbi:piezo-type mechanosensitive ion channel component-like [Euwallacea similis]|uniref:piezo-type mechanosensitive ion channel component-like n=1 Tax=Euwallacea similis TaxID=1736056 RepID=UPI003450200F